jgi:MFS family permease
MSKDVPPTAHPSALVRPNLSMAVLLPIMASVFVAFLVSGLAMPVLPLHVHNGLGLSTFVVGLVAGSQFVAALVSRPMAGQYADSRGAKHAVVIGLLAASASGLLYFSSLQFVTQPTISVGILLLGRVLLGLGESFVITGAQTWGLVLGGPNNTGKVIAWAGSAMWASFALGAPVGTFLYARLGFSAIALTTTFVPVAALLIVVRLPGIKPATRPRFSLAQVVASVWLPGLGLALSAAAFGAMTAFVALLFSSRGWTVWPVFTVFAGVFILARVFFGHVADNVGGATPSHSRVITLSNDVGQTIVGDELDPNVGIAGQEVCKFRPEDCLDRVLTGRNPDCPGRLFAQLTHRGKLSLDFFKARFHRAHQAFARFGKRNTARRAGKQADAKARLKLPNRLA